MPSANFTPKIDSARALAMYDEGAGDREIAEACGVTAAGICIWRRRHGLARVAHNDNRLTTTQVRRAKNLLRQGATLTQVAAHVGISRHTVGRLRRDVEDENLRRTGVSNIAFRNAVLADKDLPRRIEKAIGLRVPTDIRLEAANDMYLELLEGRLAVGQIEKAASRFRNRAFEMAGFNHSTRSIDEENEDGFSLADMLADPDWMQPFDEILERHFANDD